MTPELQASLLGAIVGTVLGVLGTYVFDLRRAIREAREADRRSERALQRNKETVATCLLQDLRRLEFELREVYGSSAPSRAALTRPTFFYDSLHGEVRWFAAASVQPIAELFRRADHLYAASKLLRNMGGGQIKSTPHREYEFRAHAAFALQILPRAVEALRSEGGIIPAAVAWEQIAYPELPPVPQPIFDDAAARFLSAERRAEIVGDS